MKVKERLPDCVLAEADQIVNVDVSAEDLLERLKAGKVYPPERAERALENFFTPANLTRLREITLTEIAHLIDRRSRRAEADAAPRVGHRAGDGRPLQPQPQRPGALRKAARLADRLNAPWYAVYIQTPAEDLTRTDAATQRRRQEPRAGPAARRLPMTFRGATSSARSSPSRGSTGSRSSSWARAAGPGTAGFAGPRSSTGCSAIEGIDVMIVDV